MLGLGRNGLRSIAGRRALSSVLTQTSTPSQTPPPQEQQPKTADGTVRRAFTKTANRPFTASTSAEQMRLQKKYKEKLESNKLDSLHEAVEYVEWRGTVFPQTMAKIVSLMEKSADLSAFSDRQISVLLSVFGATCDTVSRSMRAQQLQKVEEILRGKGVVLGLLGRNKLIEVKIDNRTKVDAVEELGKFDDSGVEMDGNSYALLCEVYAKQANTKAITDIIAHMKASGIALTEDHVAQLVYSVSRGGNDLQVGRIVETFSTSMNVVRLRCAAARAIAEREKNESGRGVFEVTEMLRSIPTTAKLHSFDNNVYVINVLMDLIENGQLDAFNFLSPYLIIAESGSTLAENKLNMKVVARAKSILSEGNTEEAIALYSCAHPSYSNDFFVQKLRNQLEEELQNVTSSTLQSYLKTLTLAENKKLLPSANEFLLTTCSRQAVPAFLDIFDHVFESGDLRNVLTQAPHLKRSLGRQLAHILLKTVSPSEQAAILAKIATTLFAPSSVENAQGAFAFYQIVYKVANKDVKLVLPALDLIPSSAVHEKKEFGTAIVHELLYNAHTDHVAIEKLQILLKSDKIGQLNSHRLHGLLLKFLRTTEDGKPSVRLELAAKILAYDFPKEGGLRGGYVKFGGRNLVKFLSNQSISVEIAKRLVQLLESEQRVSLTQEEIAEGRTVLSSSPEKAEMIGRLKKSATLQRWRSSEVKDLLKEHDNFPENIKEAVQFALREVIIAKTIKEQNESELNSLVAILERVAEWRKGISKKHENFISLCNTLEANTLSKAVSTNDMVLADRIWQMRSSSPPTADVLLSYASRLFLNGEIERADEVCEVLRNSAQTIRPQTLEKMGRRLKGVDTQKMSELASYLGKSFNLREKDTRRVVLQAKTDQLQQLIKSDDIASALRMAVEETRASGRSFGQIPLMIEAIKRNDRQTLETVHTMVRTAHSSESANVNLAYALIHANHVKRARDLVERQNLQVEDKMLEYFTTLASVEENPHLLKDLFIVFNGRASTLELNKLLEMATKKMYSKNDMESLKELSQEIESTSFPLQNKLRSFFDDLERKQSESVEFD